MARTIAPLPSLAGATALDRALACCGALAGVGLTGLILVMAGTDFDVPLIIAPLGASAVLLFAVPASPLAQPWAIIGGNTVSALVGLAVGQLVQEPSAAIGITVAAAIGAMSLTRSLHPPGGAVALATLLASRQMAGAELAPLLPVVLNSTVLVGLGWAFHKVSGHGYPHRAPPPPENPHGTRDPAPQLRAGLRGDDVDAALAELHETFDIERDDIHRLVRRVEARALERTQGVLTAADIMATDIIRINVDTPPPEARRLLLKHNITALPVTDAGRHVLGFVDLRGLAREAPRIACVMVPPRCVAPETTVISLIRPMTDGMTHPAAVVDGAGRIVGIVTPTDLLLALSAMVLAPVPA